MIKGGSFPSAKVDQKKLDENWGRIDWGCVYCNGTGKRYPLNKGAVYPESGYLEVDCEKCKPTKVPENGDGEV